MKNLKSPLGIALIFGLIVPFLVMTIAQIMGSHEELAAAYGFAVFMGVVCIFMAGSTAIILISLKDSDEKSSVIFPLIIFGFIGWNMFTGMPGAIDRVLEERFYAAATDTITIGYSEEIEGYFSPISNDCSHVTKSSGGKVFIVNNLIDGESVELCGIRYNPSTPLNYMTTRTKDKVRLRFGTWPNSNVLDSSVILSTGKTVKYQ